MKKEELILVYNFLIGNSIFHLSLESLTKFWKTSLKVAKNVFTVFEEKTVENTGYLGLGTDLENRRIVLTKLPNNGRFWAFLELV